MERNAQVSATISQTTREKLDRFTTQFGLKKNFVVEQALLLFMSARTELPDEAHIPSRVVIDDANFDRLVQRLSKRTEPTRALKELMRESGD